MTQHRSEFDAERVLETRELNLRSFDYVTPITQVSVAHLVAGVVAGQIYAVPNEHDSHSLLTTPHVG